MLKFISSAVLAASVVGVALRDGEEDSLPDPDFDGPTLKERVKRVHETLDVDGDDVIDVVEAADLIYIGEESGYITHENAALFAYFILKLHHEKGNEISLKEIYDAVEDVIADTEFKPLAIAVIRECLDIIEWIIFSHGTIATFFAADTDDDYLLTEAELADKGLVRFLDDFDSNNDGELDFSEYANAVYTEAFEDGGDYEDKVDEYAFQMDYTGDLHMDNDELASYYEKPGK